MNPLFNSILALIFIVVGTIATLIMLELTGKPKDKPINGSLVSVHRLFGAVFILIFIIMIIIMIRKTGTYQEELSARAISHIAIGIALIPILFLKILLVRRYRRLHWTIIILGLATFIFSFTMNGLTTGYYFLHSSDIRYISLTEFDEDVLDENIGRAVLQKKCGKCHTLERVYRSYKSEEGWTRTINEMAVLDAPNIRDFDVKQIIFFLLKQQEKRSESGSTELSDEIGKTLVGRKCSRCHGLDRVYKAEKTNEEWGMTIDKMAEYAGEADFVADNELEQMIEHLME